jgi:hypothetical protein
MNRSGPDGTTDADISAVAQQVQATSDGVETMGIALAIVLVIVFSLVTWRILLWANRKGFGTAFIIAIGSLAPITMFLSIVALILGSAEAFALEPRPLLVKLVAFLIGPCVTAFFLWRRRRYAERLATATADTFE